MDDVSGKWQVICVGCRLEGLQKMLEGVGLEPAGNGPGSHIKDSL